MNSELQHSKWSGLLPSGRLSRECQSLICLERLPTPPQWRSVIKHHLDYPRCETKNRWHSVDAHFHDGAGSISLPLLPIKGANTPFMTRCNQSPVRLHNMQDQKLLTVCWPSFAGCGRECMSLFFDYKGSLATKEDNDVPSLILCDQL